MKNKFKKLGITALACVLSLTTAGTVANLVNSGNNGKNLIFTASLMLKTVLEWKVLTIQ